MIPKHGCAEVEDIDPSSVLVIAAGPITKTRASLASRVVLAYVADKNEYVVWKESFPNYPSFEQSSFSSGDYFPVRVRANSIETNVLTAATVKFAQRVSDDARLHFEAIEPQ